MSDCAYGLSTITTSTIKNIVDEVEEATSNLDAKIDSVAASVSRASEENEQAHKDINSQATKQLTSVEEKLNHQINNLRDATLAGFSQADLLLSEEKDSRKKEAFKLKICIAVLSVVAICFGILGIIL